MFLHKKKLFILVVITIEGMVFVLSFSILFSYFIYLFYVRILTYR